MIGSLWNVDAEDGQPNLVRRLGESPTTRRSAWWWVLAGMGWVVVGSHVYYMHDAESEEALLPIRCILPDGRSYQDQERVTPLLLYTSYVAGGRTPAWEGGSALCEIGREGAHCVKLGFTSPHPTRRADEQTTRQP